MATSTVFNEHLQNTEITSVELSTFMVALNKELLKIKKKIMFDAQVQI